MRTRRLGSPVAEHIERRDGNYRAAVRLYRATQGFLSQGNCTRAFDAFQAATVFATKVIAEDISAGKHGRSTRANAARRLRANLHKRFKNKCVRWR